MPCWDRMHYFVGDVKGESVGEGEVDRDVGGISFSIMFKLLPYLEGVCNENNI